MANVDLVGVDLGDDFRRREEAQQGADDGLPLAWTPEHVFKRLRAAFDVLRRMGGAIGPRGYANAWPAILREFSDQIDEQTRRQMERDMQEALARRAERPTADEVDMAEEALAWPLRYLGAHPMQADAVCLFTAFPQQVEEILRNRMKIARAKAAFASARENEIRAGRRSAVAQGVALWANIRIARANGDVAKIEAIKHNAQIKFNREIKRRYSELGIAAFPPKVGMPNKILSRFNLDVQRKIGAALIADGLQREKASIR